MHYAGRLTAVSMIAAALLVLAVCQEDLVGPSGHQVADGNETQEFPESWWNQYGGYLKYVNEIPGYGGHFLEDSASTLVVYVQDPDVHGQLAVEVVGKGMARDGYTSHERTVARQTPGRYPLVELIGWRLEARNLFGYWDMYSLGLSIKEQQITIDVDANLDQEAFLDAAEQDLGIPQDAVTLHVGKPMTFD